MKRTSRLTALLSLGLGSCMVGPDYERPPVPDPVTYHADSLQGESIANMPWWELFEDGVLNELITIALDENKDLGVALARVREARALVTFTRADQFPFIDVFAGGGRGRPSQDLVSGTGTSDSFEASAGLTFELDLWRKLSRATEAARADLLGKRYNREKGNRGGDTTAKGKNSPLLGDTAQRVADEQGVDRTTVKNSAKVADAMDSIADNVGEEFRQKLRSPDSKTSQKEVLELSRLAPEEQVVVAEKMDDGVKLKDARSEFKTETKQREAQDAIAAAAELAELEDYEVQYVGLPLSPRDQLMQVLAERVGTLRPWTEGSVSALSKIFEPAVQAAEQMIQLNDPANLYLRCFSCGSIN